MVQTVHPCSFLMKCGSTLILQDEVKELWQQWFKWSPLGGAKERDSPFWFICTDDPIKQNFSQVLHFVFSLTTRFPPAQSRHQSHCTPPQCAGTGWWPRRSPPAPACSAAPAALELSSAGCLLMAHIQYIKIRSYIVHLTVLFNHVCSYLTSRKQCRLKPCQCRDSPMRIADSRSLLASLTGRVSALLPSLYPPRCEGAAGGGRGGGGGPGGGGNMCSPGGGTGGRG